MEEKDLKIQALLEAISTKFAKYESDIADLRVKYTLLEQRVNGETVTQTFVNGEDNQDASTGV